MIIPFFLLVFECPSILSLTLLSDSENVTDRVICYYELNEIERLKEKKTYTFLENVYSGNITYTCDINSICCGINCCPKINSIYAFVFFLMLFFIGVAIFYICYGRKTPIYRRFYIYIRQRMKSASAPYEEEI